MNTDRLLFTVQRKLRTNVYKWPPQRHILTEWYSCFIETDFVAHKTPSQGRHLVSEAMTEQVRQTSVRSPREPTTRAS